jgi:hypothetical protein
MDYRRIVKHIVVGAAVAMLASAAQADTIYVDDDNCPGPGSGTPGDPYCSIQTAIDNAMDTDEITVSRQGGHAAEFGRAGSDHYRCSANWRDGLLLQRRGAEHRS